MLLVMLLFFLILIVILFVIVIFFVLAMFAMRGMAFAIGFRRLASSGLGPLAPILPVGGHLVPEAFASRMNMPAAQECLALRGA